MEPTYNKVHYTIGVGKCVVIMGISLYCHFGQPEDYCSLIRGLHYSEGVCYIGVHSRHVIRNYKVKGCFSKPHKRPMMGSSQVTDVTI